MVFCQRREGKGRGGSVDEMMVFVKNRTRKRKALWTRI